MPAAQIVSVINHKGGVGKTTTAVHLAWWLGRRGRNVAFIDMDVQRAATKWLSKLDPKLRVLPLFKAERIAAVIDVLCPHVDVIVADGPPNLEDDCGQRNKLMIQRSEIVLVPCRQGELDLDGTAQIIEIAEALGRNKRYGDRATRVALTAAEPNTVEFGLSRGRLAIMTDLQTANYVAKDAAFQRAARLKSVVFKMGAAGRAASAQLETLFNEVLPDEVKGPDGRDEPAGRSDPAVAGDPERDGAASAAAAA